jgi:hypothetical protein
MPIRCGRSRAGVNTWSPELVECHWFWGDPAIGMQRMSTTAGFRSGNHALNAAGALGIPVVMVVEARAAG